MSYYQSGYTIESELSGSETEDLNWVEWFCGQPGKEFYVEVDEEYINDDFNLTGLYTLVPKYRKALDLILDIADADESWSTQSEECQAQLDASAQLLYGLIHARFILTNRGMQLMQEKFESCIYGKCPNVQCLQHPMMPVGLSDHPGRHTAKVFCPSCNEIYFTEHAGLAIIDGAFFGTSFVHLYFMKNAVQNRGALVRSYYEPKIWGFKVHRNVKDSLRGTPESRNSAYGTGKVA